MTRLLRVSKIDDQNFPLKKATIYKWIHLRKYPELFTQIGGARFINLDRFEELIAKGGTRQK